MKKLALKLDDLSVDSFATSSESASAPGTVHGYGTTDPSCYRITQDAACGPQQPYLDPTDRTCGNLYCGPLQ